MKIKNIYVALLATTVVAFSSCTKDLEVFPLDDNIISSDKAYSDAASYTKALNKIYSVWSLSGQDGPGSSDIDGLDPGNTVLLRSWWTIQTNTTDESKCAWGDSWVKAINSLTWNTSQVESVEGVYQRSMYVVALVNDFMKNIGNAPEGIDKDQYRAEARFCRALAYYTLLDMFANPPFITEDNYSLSPAPKTRTDLFNWIEAELKDAREVLPARYNQYGRSDKSVVDALLARMYLNAQVYTGTDRYADCIASCKSIIASGYQLADNYAELFMADNGENPETLKEIIFPIISDGLETQSYGIGAIILGSRSGSEANVETFGCEGGWDGFRTTGNLVRSFDFGNLEESKWTADNIVDKRGIFFNDNRSIDITTTAIGTFKSEGWAVYKYTNKTSNGGNGKNKSFPDTDFLMFRLAGVYLMYAEATARGGAGGDISLATSYVNQLRARGYGNNNHSVTSDWLTASAKVGGTSASIKYGNILNELARELYWEGTRRTDLIRYGVFTGSEYVWSEKGGIVTGVGVTDKFNLMPIPQSDISVNGSLVQNPGY